MLALQPIGKIHDPDTFKIRLGIPRSGNQHPGISVAYLCERGHLPLKCLWRSSSNSDVRRPTQIRQSLKVFLSFYQFHIRHFQNFSFFSFLKPPICYHKPSTSATTFSILPMSKILCPLPLQPHPRGVIVPHRNRTRVLDGFPCGGSAGRLAPPRGHAGRVKLQVGR